MNASRELRNEAMSLLATDADTLAPVALANKMCLAKADFVPNEALLIGDMTEADFDGYVSISVAVGPQNEGYDPTTDASVVDLIPPIGGFRWSTSGITLLPMTIYGYYLTDNAKGVLYASKRFETPIVLTGTLQVIDIGPANLSLNPNTIY
jgi:hypothetical protein